METLLKSDIFFFVSAVQTVIVTLLLIVVFFYVIRIVRELNSISISIKEGLTDSQTYVAELKERLNSNLLFRFFFPSRRKFRRE